LGKGFIMIGDSKGKIIIFLDFVIQRYFRIIPFQQLIQNVGENANFGYSLEDIIKW